MELRRSERRKRVSSAAREALSDLTNTSQIFFSTSSKSKPKPPPGPKSPPFSNLDANSDKSSSSIGSSIPENPRRRRIPKNRHPLQQISGSVAFDKSKHSMVHLRQSIEGRRDKGKTIAEPVALRCSPVEKIRNSGGKLKVESIDVLHDSSRCKRRKRKQQNSVSSDDSLQGSQESVMSPENIEKLRAYFAEIDAFDLPEEVVSESELE